MEILKHKFFTLTSLRREVGNKNETRIDNHLNQRIHFFCEYRDQNACRKTANDKCLQVNYSTSVKLSKKYHKGFAKFQFFCVEKYDKEKRSERIRTVDNAHGKQYFT